MDINCRRSWQFAIAVLIAAAAFLSTPISVWALHMGGSTGHGVGYTSVKAEDVRNTLHNLSSSNLVAGVNITTGAGGGTTEVCVFCHTPHGANLGAPGSAPLWNRAISQSGGTFTMYSAPNFERTSISGRPVGVSLACLSCHDGSISLDALINLPGSGGFVFTNNISNAGDAFGGTTNLVQPAGGSDFLLGTQEMSSVERTDSGPNYGVIETGAAPFPNLTRNLEDDHPLSFEFPNGQGSFADDPQFSAVGGDLRSVNQVGQIGVIASTFLVTPVDVRDALRTYPADGGVTWTTPGWIECASCHNPHAPRPVFLRLPNTSTALPTGGGTQTLDSAGLVSLDFTLVADNPNGASAICLSCHNK